MTLVGADATQSLLRVRVKDADDQGKRVHEVEDLRWTPRRQS